MWLLCADLRVEFQLWQVWSYHTATWLQSLFCTRSGDDRLQFRSCCTMNIAGVQLVPTPPSICIDHSSPATRRGRVGINQLLRPGGWFQGAISRKYRINFKLGSLSPEGLLGSSMKMVEMCMDKKWEDTQLHIISSLWKDEVGRQYLRVLL